MDDPLDVIIASPLGEVLVLPYSGSCSESRAVSVCNLDIHMMGNHNKRTTSKLEEQRSDKHDKGKDHSASQVKVK